MTFKKVDLNQKEIVKALRSMGTKVAITSNLGFGFPDLVIGISNSVYLIELKNGHKATLTEAEKIFMANWEGMVNIICSVEEAVDFVNSKRAQLC